VIVAKMSDQGGRLRCQLDRPDDGTFDMVSIGESDGNLSIVNNSGVLNRTHARFAI
jgi:hypothetical protein